MKHRLTYALAMIALGVAGHASIPAHAASGVGPYYATPSWDQTLPAATRFVVLTNMASEAVLDRETGLVWEKEPSTGTFRSLTALSHCVSLNTGGRAGWRLPTVQELLSVVDRSMANPALPSGHPFSVQSSVYWSATIYAGDPTDALVVNFGDGHVTNIAKSSFPPILLRAWCVRGGQGPDAQ